MASLNKAMLIGNLGRDPEIRYTQSGEAVATLAIATSSVWKDKSGQKQESTEWHRVVFFGRQAEICQQYLKKGASVYVEGKIQTRKWTDPQGVERYTTEISGSVLNMLASKNDGQNSPSEPPRADAQHGADNYAKASGGSYSRSPPQAAPQTSNLNDDVPF